MSMSAARLRRAGAEIARGADTETLQCLPQVQPETGGEIETVDETGGLDLRAAKTVGIVIVRANHIVAARDHALGIERTSHVGQSIASGRGQVIAHGIEGDRDLRRLKSEDVRAETRNWYLQRHINVLVRLCHRRTNRSKAIKRSQKVTARRQTSRRPTSSRLDC